MNLRRVRGILGVSRFDVPAVLNRSMAMYNGFAGDPATYASPTLALPAFLVLIQNATAAQQLALLRGKGAAGARDVQRDLLLTGMEIERMFVQALADATPSRAVSLIENAGLLVAPFPVHNKAMLTLGNGNPSGTVTCSANIGLLVGAGATMPHQGRFFNWEYTLDGSKTFVAMPPTSRSKTSISNLTPLTMVGVRVNLNNSEGPGPWSQVVTILVR
jgi:hypothetical protein